MADDLPPGTYELADRAYDREWTDGASQGDCLKAALAAAAPRIRADQVARDVALAGEFGAVVIDSDGSHLFGAYLEAAARTEP